MCVGVRTTMPGSLALVHSSSCSFTKRLSVGSRPKKSCSVGTLSQVIVYKRLTRTFSRLLTRRSTRAVRRRAYKRLLAESSPCRATYRWCPACESSWKPRAVGAPKRQTTFCLANGTNDPKVKFPWAQWSKEALRAGGCDVHLISYLYVFFLPVDTMSSAMLMA
jgi:hypothetical protein